MTMPRPDTIIAPSPAQRRTLYADGDTGDIVRAIMYADKRSGQFVQPEAVQRLQGSDQYHTLENIYWFVKRNVQYQADAHGREVVRSPGYLFDTGTGDCKSLSIAIGALCRAFGIPYRYRFIRQGNRPNLHHVYVVAYPTDGSANGDAVLLDAVHRSFNAEPRYTKKIDLKPGQSVPASIGDLGNSGSSWLLLGLVALWLFR